MQWTEGNKTYLSLEAQVSSFQALTFNTADIIIDLSIVNQNIAYPKRHAQNIYIKTINISNSLFKQYHEFHSKK